MLVEIEEVEFIACILLMDGFTYNVLQVVPGVCHVPQEILFTILTQGHAFTVSISYISYFFCSEHRFPQAKQN